MAGRALMLAGAPGTGKTALALAISQVIDFAFFSSCSFLADFHIVFLFFILLDRSWAPKFRFAR
jgi:MoxR-like ATPase